MCLENLVSFDHPYLITGGSRLATENLHSLCLTSLVTDARSLHVS